jgi:hypothetical protein
MATAEEVSWGKYREFEGPFYRGKHGFAAQANPSAENKILAVITATEGGHWDAYNGYDRCVCTSGLIQWCEAGQYSVSDMLGAVARRDPALIKPVTDLIKELGFEFRANSKGQWRFWFRDARGEVNVLQEQQQLFLLNSNGKKGSWDEPSKKYAKRWAAAISSVWEDREAQAVQSEYTVKRLGGFLLPYAKEFFGMTPATDVGHAFKAMYLSFAANNPTWANRHLEIANKGMKASAYWTIDWLIAVTKEMTFGPKVAIYPHRYAAIRPVLEKLYSVDLPDMSAELQKWSPEMRAFAGVYEVQQALLSLGYDLGPKGADGVFGGKTKDALLTFQQLSKFSDEAQTSMPDEPTVIALAKALEQHARAAFSGGSAQA